MDEGWSTVLNAKAHPVEFNEDINHDWMSTAQSSNTPAVPSVIATENSTNSKMEDHTVTDADARPVQLDTVTESTIPSVDEQGSSAGPQDTRESGAPELQHEHLSPLDQVEAEFDHVEVPAQQTVPTETPSEHEVTDIAAIADSGIEASTRSLDAELTSEQVPQQYTSSAAANITEAPGEPSHALMAENSDEVADTTPDSHNGVEAEDPGPGNTETTPTIHVADLEHVEETQEYRHEPLPEDVQPTSEHADEETGYSRGYEPIPESDTASNILRSPATYAEEVIPIADNSAPEPTEGSLPQPESSAVNDRLSSKPGPASEPVDDFDAALNAPRKDGTGWEDMTTERTDADPQEINERLGGSDHSAVEDERSRIPLQALGHDGGDVNAKLEDIAQTNQDDSHASIDATALTEWAASTDDWLQSSSQTQADSSATFFADDVVETRAFPGARSDEQPGNDANSIGGYEPDRLNAEAASASTATVSQPFPGSALDGDEDDPFANLAFQTSPQHPSVQAHGPFDDVGLTPEPRLGLSISNSDIAQATDRSTAKDTSRAEDFFNNSLSDTPSEQRPEDDLFGKDDIGDAEVPDIFSNDAQSTGAQTTAIPANVPEDIGDSWAKALASPGSGLDDAWGAALGDDLDDDFLEDVSAPLPTLPPTASPIAAPTSAMSPILTGLGGTMAALQPAPQPTNTYSSYAPTPSVQSPPTKPAASAAPMEFFADLPTQPFKVKRMRPSAPAVSPAPAAVPPRGPAVPSMPPRTSSTANVGTLQNQFRPPEPLDLFPPQAESRAPNAFPPTTLPQSYASQVVAPPVNTRYSPAPTQPQTTANAAQSSPPAITRFGATPTQPPEPSGIAPSTGLPARASPYAPNMPGGWDMARTASYSRQMLPSGPAIPSPQLSSSQINTPPKPNPRYSPAPSTPESSIPQGRGMPPATARDYAAHAGPAPQTANRFVPRTSSPLAQPKQRPHYDRLATMPMPRPDAPLELPHARHRSVGDINDPQQGGPVPVQSESHPSAPQPPISYPPARRVDQQSAPSMPNGGSSVRPAPRVPKPIERSTSYAYMPQSQPNVPLARPRTSSPTAIRATMPFTQAVPDRTMSAQHTDPNAQVPLSSTAHEAFGYVLPADATAIDPLQRWRGSPIFTWGPAGHVVTSIPKHIPRYSGGQAAPKLKCLSGEVKLQKSKDLFVSIESLTSFPGPLKAKNKKKEVLLWLNHRIVELERDLKSVPGDVSTNNDDHTRLGDQLVLWQTMRIMVEHDGMLSGNPAIVAAVIHTLQPETSTYLEGASPSTSGPTNGIPSSTFSEGGNPAAVSEIRLHLLRGDRDKAVWHAVDNKLWAHAMLISSTGDPKVWKQVAQEFVKHEVRGVQTGHQSLAALYEVFAGNWDESVDQLIPLSARSGFQMVSTLQQPGQNVDALQGLEKWRETLCLIIGNRSNGDEQALLSLGRLLSGYGRIEAAHVCYLFARSVARFRGSDDANAHFTILGADLTPTGTNSGHDLDAIMLSEVYEFALSLPGGSSAYYVPHLQAYKLHHAYALAEAGMRSEAQQYCDVIASALKASTKLSPYYHMVLASQLDDFSKRLSQTPRETTGGLFSKPTIGNLSSGMGKWIGKFIEGSDEKDAANGTASPNEEAGLFARLSGGTPPTITRNPSMTDLQGYGYDPSQTGTGNSRYAPNGGAMGDAARSTSSSYAPSAYAPLQYAPSAYGSPEQLQRQSSYIGSDVASSMYNGPPTVPPLSRQPSSLSRYSMNGGASSPSYEPQVPTIAESTYSDYSYSAPSPPRMESRQSPRRSSTHAPSPLGMMENATSDEQGYPHTASSASYGGYQPSDAVDQSDGSASLHPSAGYASSPAGYQRQSLDSQPDYAPQVADYGGSTYNQPPADDENVEMQQQDSAFSFQPYAPTYTSEAGNDPSQAGDDAGLNGSSYDPSAGGYQPSSSGYVPSSYTPYQPDTSTFDETADVAEDASRKPKKKSFLDDDDDDDFVKRAAQQLKSSGSGGASKGREVDDAVRQAAEADAARDAAAASQKSGSWFSAPRWFGKREDKDSIGSAASAKEPTVYKAKLGEESSFFFDPETKRWVNRKAQAAGEDGGSSPSAPTPPPPRAGPPMGGPPGGGSRTASPAMGAATGRPPSGGSSRPPSLGAMSASGGGPPGMHVALPGSGPPSAPPSRPPTSLSGASDIDDLLSAPRVGGGGTRRGKKGGRYVDVMAK